MLAIGKKTSYSLTSNLARMTINSDYVIHPVCLLRYFSAVCFNLSRTGFTFRHPLNERKKKKTNKKTYEINFSGFNSSFLL